MTRLELAAKCEAATGPDRELDGEIHCTAFSLEGPEREKAMARIGVLGPRYTASINAAMTLIPEGMDWFKERGTYVPNIAVIQGPTCSFVGETDSTFALALCAASLRARNEQVTK